MRIDFSEPECSNCFHCRMLYTQESEPSNVIASSEPVNSEPVQSLEEDSAAVASTSASTSSPVQALEHESAAVGSTSTSSPNQTLGHESSAVGSTSTSSPVQALEHDSAAVGSTSTSSPIQALGHDPAAAVGSTSISSPIQSLGHDSAAAVGSTSTSSPVQALGHDSAATGSISSFSLGSQTPSAPPVVTSVFSGPVQTLAPSLFRSDVFGSPFQTTSGSGASATSLFGSAPAVTSVNSAPTTQAFGQNTSPFGCSPNSFGFTPAVTSVSSAPTTQAFGQNTSAFGCSPNSFGFTPAVTSVSSAPTPAFGQNTSAFGCSPNSFGFTPAVTSVNSAPTTQAFGRNTSSFGCSPNSFGFTPAVTSVNSAPTTQAFGQNTSAFGWSPNSFGSAPAVTSVSSAPPTPAFGQNSLNTSGLFGPEPAGNFGRSLFAAHTQPALGSTQAPVASGTSPSPSFLPFGSIPAPPTNTSSLFRPSQDYPRTCVNRFAFRSSPSNPFGFPGYGVDYLPGSKPNNPFGQRQNTSGGGFSIFASPKTSPPQPFAPFSSTGCNPFRAPTVDGDSGGTYMSVSVSTLPYKSHEELRWEDYQKGNKGSKTNTPLFAFPSVVPVHPQRPTFGPPQETFTGPAFSFSQQNPAFTGFGTPSSSASGCTACGATTSTSASSGNWTFNGATFAPPSAATTSLPGLFYPMYGSVPMMFGTSPAPQVTGSVPMMFGTSPAAQVTGCSVPMMFGTSPAAQVTTPALQAYPVNGYILLPFAAMNLH